MVERLEKRSQEDKQKKYPKFIKIGLIVLVLLMLFFAMVFEKMGIQVPKYYGWLTLFLIALSPFVRIDSKKQNKTAKLSEKDIIYTLIDPEEIEEMRRKKGFINTFEHRMDVLEECNNNKKNIENKDITLKVIHHRLRSAWCSPSCPNGVPDDAVEVFNDKLKYNVVDIIDKKEGRQIVLVIDFIADKIKCVMKSCSNVDVYDAEFLCNYNEPYEYHEALCDAMESWEFFFEENQEKTMIKKSSILNRWDIEEKIFKNIYGDVFAIKNRETNELNYLEIISFAQSHIDMNFIAEIGKEGARVLYKQFLEKIENEIKIIQSLKSENIVGIKEYEVISCDNDIRYDILIRMEKIKNVNCNYLVNKDIKEKIRFAIDICEALEKCEENNVIHGNLGFNSVYMSENEQYKLGNFRSEQLEQLYSTMARRGTYNYMAPEMYKGETYDHRADIYSLGIMLYQVFNEGLLPFEELLPFTNNGNSFAVRNDAYIKRIKGIELPKPSQADDKVAKIILKACSYSPSQRYQTAHELRKELEMVTVASPKNSFEVLEKVKKLQPEIDRLVELEYIKSVERRLDNISEHKEALKETIGSYKEGPIETPEYLINELKEIEFVETLSGKERKKYIKERVRREMNMFGSCHGIWSTQKRILKEVYNIDWLTPSEEHPEIMFD